MTLAAFGEGFHPLRAIHVAALNRPGKAHLHQPTRGIGPRFYGDL